MTDAEDTDDQAEQVWSLGSVQKSLETPTVDGDMWDATEKRKKTTLKGPRVCLISNFCLLWKILQLGFYSWSLWKSPRFGSTCELSDKIIKQVDTRAPRWSLKSSIYFCPVNQNRMAWPFRYTCWGNMVLHVLLGSIVFFALGIYSDTILLELTISISRFFGSSWWLEIIASAEHVLGKNEWQVMKSGIVETILDWVTWKIHDIASDLGPVRVEVFKMTKDFGGLWCNMPCKQICLCPLHVNHLTLQTSLPRGSWETLLHHGGRWKPSRRSTCPNSWEPPRPKAVSPAFQSLAGKCLLGMLVDTDVVGLEILWILMVYCSEVSRSCSDQWMLVISCGFR